MHLTLALPALNQPDFAKLPATLTPALNQLLRFGTFTPQAARPSEFYGHYLWQGSLLAHAKAQLGLATNAPTAFATPVWQQMGMHSMSMLAGADIGINMQQAQRLCAGLDDFYQADGWRFLPVRADLWLLVLPALPDWQVPPLPDAIGHNDGTVRAEGRDAAAWLQAQTEIQMWLHSHALNAERQREGAPAINGVWLWQDIIGHAHGTATLGSDSPWAQYYPGRRLDAPYDFAAWQAMQQEAGCAGAESLLFLHDLAAAQATDDIWAYRETLLAWEVRFFAPTWQALQQGILKSLCISTDGSHGGMLSIKAKAGRAFWKKKKTFAGELD